MTTQFFCVPICIACRDADACSMGPPPPPKVTRKKTPAKPNDELLRMPCGCWGIPWGLWHILGKGDEAWMMCDVHGVQKITKAWQERAKKGYSAYLKRIPSEFGYRVEVKKGEQLW